MTEKPINYETHSIGDLPCDIWFITIGKEDFGFDLVAFEAIKKKKKKKVKTKNVDERLSCVSLNFRLIFLNDKW